MYLNAGIEIPKPIAGLLLSGIISDTLNLTSPTATKTDSNMLKYLEQVTELNAAEFTDALFSSGSVLTHRAPKQAKGRLRAPSRLGSPRAPLTTRAISMCIAPSPSVRTSPLSCI